MSTKYKYKRVVNYADTTPGNIFTEFAASFSEVLDRELKWVLGTIDGRVLESLEISREEKEAGPWQRE
jgi:hypothetical protein